MKIKRFIHLIVMLGVLFAGCSQPTTVEEPATTQPSKKKPIQPKPSNPPTHPVFDAADSVENQDRIPVDFGGNYVWSAAMNLAWREMKEKILHGPAKLDVQSELGRQMVRKLNFSKFSGKDLDSKSYYVKSGYGQQTVEAINQDISAKFPKAKIAPLQVKLEKTHFINYAVYRKEMKYVKVFYSMNVKFKGKKVKGFGGDQEAIAETIRILSYESDDKFLIQLNVVDPDDRLYLAKGYAMQSPKDVLAAIPRKDPADMERTVYGDRFEAPMLKFKFDRNFEALEHVFFKNPGFEQHEIVAMQEAIDFQMDRFGARVTSVAMEIGADSAGMAPPVPKNLLLNKPYWVIMKRKDSPRPYFILGVRNTAMMKAAD
jgi:hypothetical protein